MRLLGLKNNIKFGVTTLDQNNYAYLNISN